MPEQPGSPTPLSLPILSTQFVDELLHAANEVRRRYPFKPRAWRIGWDALAYKAAAAAAAVRAAQIANTGNERLWEALTAGLDAVQSASASAPWDDEALAVRSRETSDIPALIAVMENGSEMAQLYLLCQTIEYSTHPDAAILRAGLAEFSFFQTTGQIEVIGQQRRLVTEPLQRLVTSHFMSGMQSLVNLTGGNATVLSAVVQAVPLAAVLEASQSNARTWLGQLQGEGYFNDFLIHLYSGLTDQVEEMEMSGLRKSLRKTARSLLSTLAHQKRKRRNKEPLGITTHLQTIMSATTGFEEFFEMLGGAEHLLDLLPPT
jgi:hypothetical protein